MNEIITERTGNILRIQFNRPDKKNAMTSSMYTEMATLLNDAAKDDQIRVVLWHSAGDTFCAGNDLEDFLKHPPGPVESPQSQLESALLRFEKPIVVAIQGAAVGGGVTIPMHCDFVYAAEGAKFQLPFVNLALVPEFGSSMTIPALVGHLRAAELIMLGLPFGAKQAVEYGLATRIVPEAQLLAVATDTARALAEKSVGALQAIKRLLKRATRDQIEEAMKIENVEFAALVQSPDSREALSAFLEKRRPDFTKGKTL